MISTVEDLVSKIKSSQIAFEISLYGAASELDINRFEKIKGIRLPRDIRDFYGFYNGFVSQYDWFRIIPLNEILENPPSNHQIGYNDFHIAEFMFYSDMWTVAISEQDSENYTIYRKADGGQLDLTNSIVSFLDRYLLGGVDNLYKWEEEIYQERRSKGP
jgi:hypothetical protein